MIQLTLNVGAGETWTLTVTDDGAPLNLSGWSVDLFDLPTGLGDLVSVEIGNAAAGEIILRILPGASSRGYRFWVRLTPDDDDLDVATLPLILTVA